VSTCGCVCEMRVSERACDACESVWSGVKLAVSEHVWVRVSGMRVRDHVHVACDASSTMR